MILGACSWNRHFKMNLSSFLRLEISSTAGKWDVTAAKSPVKCLFWFARTILIGRFTLKVNGLFWFAFERYQATTLNICVFSFYEQEMGKIFGLSVHLKWYEFVVFQKVFLSSAMVLISVESSWGGGKESSILYFNVSNFLLLCGILIFVWFFSTKNSCNESVP